MLDNLKKYHIKLASNSPRRRELLAGLGIEFETKVLPDIDESYPDTLKGEEISLYIASKKADAYRTTLQPDELIITADTIVYLDGLVLGKPHDAADARRMLTLLSGRTHQVITGVCILTASQQRSFAVTTEVTFDTLSEEEISYYVEKYHPMDKAGSYGIQGYGSMLVEGISGDYFNVVGLPVCLLGRMLTHFGVDAMKLAAEQSLKEGI